MKAVLVSLLASAAVLSAEPVATLAGIQVVVDDGGEEFDGFKTFNSDKGTQVALIVRSGGKTIVSVEPDEASLTVGGVEARCRFFGDSAYSEDRTAVRLEFEAEEPVKAGADGKLVITGDIPLRLATGSEEIRSEVVALEAGAKVVFPEKEKDLPALEVKSLGKPDFGDAALKVSFATNRKADEFAAIRFFDAKGGVLEADRRGSSWMEFNGRGSGQIEFEFEEAADKVVVGIERWTGVEAVSVTVDLEAGLGAAR